MSWKIWTYPLKELVSSHKIFKSLNNIKSLNKDSKDFKGIVYHHLINFNTVYCHKDIRLIKFKAEAIMWTNGLLGTEPDRSLEYGATN